MKQDIRKLFSLLLALVMALSLAVPAFAGEGGQPEKELRWVHLDWNEDGCSASPDALKNDDPGEGNGTGYDPSRQDAVLFFIWNNRTNKREGYVVPTAGGGMRVEKIAGVDKNAIAKGAKQSQYYVFLYMDKFQDSELTAKGLTFHVTAMLGDFGFYSAETPSAGTILAGEVEAGKLTGSTLYFCAPYMGAGEEKDHDAVSKVEKDPNMPDHNKCYDIEKVKDGLWRLTINEAGQAALTQWGGVGINLKLEVKQPDGSTREDGRGIYVKGEDQGPQLWFADIAGEWDDAAQQDVYFVNDGCGGQGNGKQVHSGYENHGIFGTIQDGEEPYTENGFNWDAFTPVEVDSLKTTGGITVESVAGQAREGEKWAKYFVRVSVAENGKEYKVTSGDYAITIDSGLPDIGVYTAPTASFDTWAGEYEYPYHPAKADNTYYIISTATDAKYGRHLTDARLSTANLGEDCGNALVSLEKAGDGVCKLTVKDTSRNRFHAELDLTWTDFTGNTWTDHNCGFGDFYLAPCIVAASTKLTDKYDEPLPYSEIAGKVSTALSMTAGESRTVYLYTTPIRQDGLQYRAFSAAYAANFRSSDPALTLSFDEKDPSKFTLTASKPGNYEIWMGGQDWDFENMKFFHADGTPYTEAETEAWHNDPTFYIDVNSDGKMLVWKDSQTVKDAVSFETYFNGDTYELKPLDGLQDYGWKHLTVTVTGEAEPKKAIPTNNSLTVNGKAVDPVAYKIDGANYFKLRDLAALLNGTEKQFDVGYDGAARTAAITTKKGYTKLPTDLQPAPAGEQTAVVTNDSVLLDGKPVQLTVYKVNGANFFKLRDLGQALDFYVGYDGAAKSASIDTSRSYAPNS